jgi:hypothetical protein
MFEYMENPYLFENQFYSRKEQNLWNFEGETICQKTRQEELA